MFEDSDFIWKNIPKILPLFDKASKILFKKNQLPNIEERRKAISCTWKGECEQYQIPKGMESNNQKGTYSYKVEFEFKNKDENCLFGYVKAYITHSAPLELYFTGDFIHSQFIRLNFENNNKGIPQSGTVILKIQLGNKSMEGGFTGISFTREDVVEGHFELTKK